MATRNRIIYQSVALYSSPVTGSGGINSDINSTDVTALQRVTDINWGGEVTRQDINVMGQLANISREIIEEPTVNLDFSYNLSDGFNETGCLGLASSTGGTVNLISGFLAEEGSLSERNYYILTVPEGVDAHNAVATGADRGVIGVGNAFLSSYSVNMAVGEIATANVQFEAANLTFAIPTGESPKPTGSFQNPAINRTGTLPGIQDSGTVVLPTYVTNTSIQNVLRPGDITLSFDTGSLAAGGAILPGMDEADSKQEAHVQSVSIEVPLARTPINKLGNPFSFSRPLDVPVNVSLTVNANVGDITTGSLVNLICDDDAGRNIDVTLKDKCSTGQSMKYSFKGAKIDSQSMSQSVGDNQTVELTFSAQIGGVNDQSNGVFLHDPSA